MMHRWPIARAHRPRSRGVERILASIVVGFTVGACTPIYFKRTQEYCTVLHAELEAQASRGWSQQARQGGLSLHAAEVYSHGISPHGGPHVCYVVGLVPEGWHRTERFETTTLTAPNTAGDHGTLRYGWMTTPVDPSGSIVDYIERIELGPGRERGAIEHETASQADEGREQRRVLLTRNGEVQRLLVLRWRQGGWDYLRCEATLTGKYAAWISVFEAACMSAEVRRWRYPES